MSQPPIPHRTPAAAPATTPEPNQPVTYRTPRQMRRAAFGESAASIAHGSTPTDREMRAILDAATLQTLQRQIAAAHPETVVTIEVHRHDWECSYREFRCVARRAPNLIRHCQRLANATCVRVRVGNGLWFDVPLHASSITAA